MRQSDTHSHTHNTHTHTDKERERERERERQTDREIALTCVQSEAIPNSKLALSPVKILHVGRLRNLQSLESFWWPLGRPPYF